MGKYIITAGQNLYDVALHIYGSIEGITDLMVNNPTLSMASTLRAGQELVYTDDYLINSDVVANYRQRDIRPANGERNVYFNESQYPRIAEFRIPAAATSTTLSFSGSGVMEIDWGDNAPLQNILLSDKLVHFTHFFDNTIADDRIIRLCGNFRIRQADFTALKATVIFFLDPLYVEEIVLQDCAVRLDFLPLLHGLHTLDLSQVKTASLLPLVQCRELKRLDLTGVDVLRETLDEFLISIVREYYGRRNCEIILTEFPSGEYREPPRDEKLNYIVNTGMEAVWLLTHEESWNEAGAWVIHIGEQRYEYTAAEPTVPNEESYSAGK